MASDDQKPAVTSDFARTILIAVVTGILAAIGTLGASYLTGYFEVRKTEEGNANSVGLEKLKFANDLVKTALTTNNAANSLLFYADIGLLNDLKVDAVKDYANKEKAKLSGSDISQQSILPNFGPSSQRDYWLDRSFIDSFAPKGNEQIKNMLITTGNYILQGFSINTSAARLAAFLGLIAYETAGFTQFVENGAFSSDRLLQVFPKDFDADSAKEYAKLGPEKILSRVYANRNGNGPESSGDGFKYRGRGLIQITGKDNYANFSKLTGIDIISDPDLAGNPDAALLIAAAYWNSLQLSRFADAGDLTELGRRAFVYDEHFLKNARTALDLLSSKHNQN